MFFPAIRAVHDDKRSVAVTLRFKVTGSFFRYSILQCHGFLLLLVAIFDGVRLAGGNPYNVVLGCGVGVEAITCTDQHSISVQRQIISLLTGRERPEAAVHVEAAKRHCREPRGAKYISHRGHPHFQCYAS